jgi:hypothetical protein
MAAKTSDPIDILLEMGIDLDNLSEEEDYLSALKEAIAKIQFQTKGAGNERSAILSQEVIKVRKSRKAADPKFKAKKTTIKPDAFFDKKEPTAQSQPVPGQRALPGKGPAAIVKRKTIKPEAFKKSEEPEQDEKKKRKTKKSDPLKDILKAVNSILATLKNSNKITKKQAERDRKDAEKAKRGAREDKLETSPMKKFFAGAKKLAKPAINFFESIMKFIINILIGRLLVKILSWMGDPDNSKKMTAIMDFFKVTWPAFLAAFLAFQFGLGGFITGLLGLIGGFIPKLLGLIPRMLAGLGKLATGNPILVAAAAGAALFALGKIVPEVAPQTVETDTDKKVDESIKKKGGEQTATDLGEEQATKEGERNAFQNFFFGKVMGEDAEYEKQLERAKTGKEPEFGKKFNKGGIVPGSGPNKDTVPAMLTPGEFVMSRGAVQTYGSDTLESMNAMGGGTNVPSFSFNAGGIVPGYNGGGHVDPDKEVGKADEDKERPKLDPASTTTEQPKKKGRNLLSMYAGYLDFVTGNVFDIDGMGKPSSMSASPEKEAPKKEGEKSGGGGSLNGLTGQDFRDLAFIVSAEAQRGTDDEYGVAAAVLNRVADPAWPNTVKAVGSQAGQFEAVYKGLAKDDPELAAKLASPEGQAKIVEAMKQLKGRTDFKGTSQYGNMGPSDIKFSDRGNFYHYKEQVGKTDPPPSPIPTFYQKFIGTGGPAVTLNGTKSSASGITASPGPGGGGPGGGDSKTPAAQMRSAGGAKPLPPPSRGQKLSDLYAQQEARAGRGSSSGSSAGTEGANPGALNTPNSNDLPPIDANAMISMEKIKVLGLTVV